MRPVSRVLKGLYLSVVRKVLTFLIAGIKMDDMEPDRVQINEDWFTICKQMFRNLSPVEKSSVILTLIDMCDTTARFNLLKSCNKALHCDILASMPQIALDKILGMLSVPDILNACKVSPQWNK